MVKSLLAASDKLALALAARREPVHGFYSETLANPMEGNRSNRDRFSERILMEKAN
jgi:hypothetical protein